MAKKNYQTTKKQFKLMLDYLELSKDIVYQGKCLPLKDNHYKLKCDELTSILNACGVGHTKTMEQWKSVYTELKTNTKRHYCVLKKDFTATGGVEKKAKPMFDYEERLLSLLSQTSIDEKSSLIEAGVPDSNCNVAGLSQEQGAIVFDLDVEPMDGDLETTSEAVNQNVLTDEHERQMPEESVNKLSKPRTIPKHRKIRPIRRSRVSRKEETIYNDEDLVKQQLENGERIIKSNNELTMAVNGLSAAIPISAQMLADAFNVN